MLTRQIVIKNSGRVVLHWEEVEGITQTAFFQPEPGMDLVRVAGWLTSVVFQPPAVALGRPVFQPSSVKDISAYRLVASKREDGRYRVSYYTRTGSGEKVETAVATYMRGLLNTMLRKIEIEIAELPTQTSFYTHNFKQ